jgi:phosphinothricin acetyltransferase
VATIRSARPLDAARIAEIYNHYVREAIATFEERPLATDEMARRIADVTPRLPWIVAEEGGIVTGYAYATPWKSRSAYRFTVETTVYLAHDAVGRGLGTALYESLLETLRRDHRELRTAVACIALPHPASVALHEKLGFVKVGHFPDVGFKFGRWIDVGYWQLPLGSE